MFNRLKALVWLRNQTIIANKNLLVQVLMPYGLLIIYKNFMNLGKDKGLDLMFLCLSTAIAMSVGSTVSTIIAEEKEKKNLKTLLLSGVRPYEYLISVLIHPVVITVLNMVLFPIIAGADLSKIYLEYTLVVILTAMAVILINLCIGAFSSTQSKAQINGLPVMLIIAMGPNLSQMNPDIADFIKYTFLGAYTELFTKAEFSLTSCSFQILIAWIICLFILTSLSLKLHKHSKPRNKLPKERAVNTECV